MTDIIPAILPKSYAELESKLDLAAGHASVVQIDICDGVYVPNRTWPYLRGKDADGAPADQIFASIVSQESALPHWEELDFEFDLMVRDAHGKIPDFISAGAARIVVHMHSLEAGELEAILADYGDLVDIGIALMPTDGPTIPEGVRFVQVMGIDRIGFQGQAFDRRSIDLVRAIRTAHRDLPIAVDGHIDLADARELISAGADRLVVGSALFDSDDFLGTLREFQEL